MLALSWRQYSPENFTVNGLTVHSVETTNDARGTGLIVWDGAFVLGKFLEKRFTTDELSKSTIIELGCGTGLAGLCAAAIGAAHVYLTDLEYALENTRRNVTSNPSLSGRVSCVELDWNCPNLDFLGTVLPDIVLLADVAWVIDLIVPLVRTCQALVNHCKSKQLKFYLAHQTRSLKTDEILFTELNSIGMEIRVLEKWEYDQDFNGVPLFELTYRAK